MTTAIVGCSKSKIETDEPVPASELYDSVYFDKRWSYATAITDDVCILSAKHGIVQPDTLLSPYDVSIYDLSADERRALAETIDASQFNAQIVVLAGQHYVDIIERACSGTEQTVEAPLDGGIGEQLAQLNEMLNEVGAA